MKEKSVHTGIAKYIKYQYPNVVFTSESSGLRTSIGVAKQLKGQRSAHRLPDLIIMEPRGPWCGLILELKTESPFKKDGSLKAGRAVEQSKTLELLRSKGYYASFAVGFDQAKYFIDQYMSYEAERERPFITPEADALRCEAYNERIGGPRRCLRCHENIYNEAWIDFNKQMSVGDQ